MGLGQPVVVTPDLEIAEHFLDLGLPAFRTAPPLRSVLHELKEVVDYFKPDAIIQVTGDTPFVCPVLMARTADALYNHYGFVFFDTGPYHGFPCRGISTMAFKGMFTRIMGFLEHGTTYFYTKPLLGNFLVRNTVPAITLRHHNFSVDTVEDLEWAQQVAGATSLEADYEEILECARSLEADGGPYERST